MDSKEGAASRRVLIVDDDKDLLVALRALMQSAGFEVRIAADGLEGYEAAEDFRPGVIFMDLGMPRMDGYEAARYIRRQPWGARIFLVAISGWGQAQHQRQSKAAGFDEHLVKPVSLADLLALIKGRT